VSIGLNPVDNIVVPWFTMSLCL